MIFEIFIALIIGCCFGIITGITPGLHINLVAVILFSVSVFLFKFLDGVTVIVFIIAMSITHTFSDFIAAIYLGAPSDDTALAVLPGHKMLLIGMGHEGVKLTLIGSFFGLLITILLIPMLIVVVPFIFETLRKFIGILLLQIVIFMILRDCGLNKKMCY